MKFFKIGMYNPLALQDEIDTHPYNFIKEELLLRLEFLLKFIKEKNPGILSEVINKLENKLKSDIEYSQINFKEKFNEELKFYGYLSKNTDLLNWTLLFVIAKLNIKPEIFFANKEIKIKDELRIKSFLYPRYFILEVLVDILGREEAIRLHKYYTTEYFHYYPIKNEPIKDLNSLFEERSKENSEDSPWIMVHGMIADGKYAYRNDNCLWMEVMQEFSDKELLYFTCCYGDYEVVKSYFNERFILTMEHTIAQGDKYCSRVLHDTRVDWNLAHPPKKFWDEMEY